MQESDAGIEKLKKQLDNLISEKELITSQITRKCGEIELLNQKINMMQMALDRSKQTLHVFPHSLFISLIARF
jgi:phage-related minor tail protein